MTLLSHSFKNFIKMWSGSSYKRIPFYTSQRKCLFNCNYFNIGIFKLQMMLNTTMEGGEGEGGDLGLGWKNGCFYPSVFRKTLFCLREWTNMLLLLLLFKTQWVSPTLNLLTMKLNIKSDLKYQRTIKILCILVLNLERFWIFSPQQINTQ